MMKKINYKIILQARTNSLRFPDKSLQKIHGIPLVLLCAKRLKSSHRDTSLVIATSKEKTDDKLCSLLKKNKIKVFRGSLKNVLSRFYILAKNMGKNDVIIRATADNPIPDNRLVLELKKVFERKKIKYMCLRSPQNKLPYGLSLEFIKVDLLRKTFKNATKSFDKEHINPWIDRNIKSKYKYNVTNEDLSVHDLSKLRCTVDYKKDFIEINELFRRFKRKEIFKLSWYKLINELYKKKYNSQKICFGTANLDQPYGLNSKKIKKEEIKKIIKYLKKNKIYLIDTARSYGESEKYFDDKKFMVISKLKKLDGDNNVSSIEDKILKSINTSYKNLGKEKIHSLLIHNWAEYKLFRKKILKILLRKKKQNVLNSIGASVYHPKEAYEVIEEKNFTHLQFPFNILDQRFNNKNFIKKAVGRKKKIYTYARSIFLQGLLLNKNTKPKNLKLKNVRLKIDLIKRLLKVKNNLDLCLKYINSFIWIDYFVVGVENCKQLDQISNFYKHNIIYKIPEIDIVKIQQKFKKISSNIILPYKWT